MATIVVPVVKSAAGERALDLAKQEAVARDALLLLVGTARVSDKLSENVEALRDYVTQLEKELAAEGVRYRSEWSVGEPLSHATLDAVREHDAELIVLGLRQRTPLGKAFLGSFEQEVLLDAPCPVLSVRAPFQ